MMRDWKFAKIKTPQGPWWLPTEAPNCVVANCMKAGGFYDSDVAQNLRPYIKPGTAVIDVGCCYGQMSVFFNSFVGETGMVVAVEASPFNAKLAQMNFGPSFPPIQLHHRAAFSRSGVRLPYAEHDIEKDGSFAVAGVEWRKPPAAFIESVALDDLAMPAPVSAIKIDAQGCDLHTLLGARRLIEGDRPAIIFELEPERQAALGLSWKDTERFIASVGYYVAKKIKDENNFLILPEGAEMKTGASRPCYCDDVPPDDKPYTNAYCHLCWLYHNDGGYRVTWDKDREDARCGPLSHLNSSGAITGENADRRPDSPVADALPERGCRGLRRDWRKRRRLEDL